MGGLSIVETDDSINKKSRKNIFAYGNFHDHTSKGKENRYPWSQCIVALSLIKKVKDNLVLFIFIYFHKMF